VVFGPHPKDWHYRLPRRMRRIALISSINAKLNEKNITVIDKLKLDSNKTKELSSILKGLKLGGKKIVIVPDKADDNLKRAARNIKDASLVRAEDINAYQVLINDNILVEKDALKKIEKESVEVI
jgi:large subunit ribosomal protein L4